MHQQTSQIVKEFNPEVECVFYFVERVWNAKRFSEMSLYLDDQFVDYSMPHKSLQNQRGLSLYLHHMAKTVCHNTEILEWCNLDGLVICKIRITATYLPGAYNKPLQPEIIHGFRVFKMCENRIMAHWELI